MIASLRHLDTYFPIYVNLLLFFDWNHSIKYLNISIYLRIDLVLKFKNMPIKCMEYLDDIGFICKNMKIY
jgi:hypothetical protein